MKKAIPTVWFKHLSENDQDSFKEQLRANHRILDRLVEILKDDMDQIERAEDDPNKYDAGYPYLQAYYNGRRKQIKHILDYLSFLED